MTLHEFSREIVCLAFPLTLKGAARGWFKSLPLGSIDGFQELACLFLAQFMASKKRKQPVAYLLTVKQRDNKSLKAYLSRFNKEQMTTDDQNEKIILATLLGGIWAKSHVGEFFPRLGGLTQYPEA
ncbi:uncharacterized protein LOC122316215 [Carya illinoinensis]|uniref:uncharacterized protein LOC122316215 n=1 Tax=Carya illinoinensis TaxID=32201 RepID=UPI001C72993F|nr:uncharacterized protein LOC122316215 [Carya illinoinensis]